MQQTRQRTSADHIGHDDVNSIVNNINNNIYENKLSGVSINEPVAATDQ